MEGNFEILNWDSDFFNFKVAKINSLGSKEFFLDVLEHLKSEKVKLAYCFSEPESLMDTLIKESNAFLVDEKVTYSYIINSFNYSEDDSFIDEYQQDIVTEKMLDIAIQTSEYSRFRVDKNFKNEEFKKMYYQWIKNAILKSGNDRLFVYEEANVLKGLIYLKDINSEVGSISLIGVDQGYRGDKIGTKLIVKAKKYFKGLGKSEVQVVTQKDNLLACNFYEKNKFTLIDTTNVYHLWL